MPITSTLRICGANPRYFADSSGRAIYVTGTHTWNNLVDMGSKEPIVPFDWTAYLDLLATLDHNFVRLWAMDSTATWNPLDRVLDFPWLRTGPGTASDGRPKFDLRLFDPVYFERLRSRVKEACERDIYVSVMLFESWSNFFQNETPLERHCFAARNNINGVDIVSTPLNGIAAAWCTLRSPEVLSLQKAYIRKVVESVNDYDNVVYEISNEAGAESHDWQNYLTSYVRSLEAEMPKQHAIGQTGGMGASNRELHSGNADWLSPDARRAHGYRTGHYTFGSGPFDRGDRPLLLDTDHVWGMGGSVSWVWKCFCRGYNILYMDRWDDQPSYFYHLPRWPELADPNVRREMGACRRFSRLIDLTASAPSNATASSGYCLAVPGRQYIAFEPSHEPVSLEIEAGDWRVIWHDPVHGVTKEPIQILIATSGTSEFRSPFDGPSVLFVERLSALG